MPDDSDQQTDPVAATVVPTDPVAATVASETSLGTDATRAGGSATPSSGTLPARYRLAGSLGAGGMGEVLLARDTQIDRDVAIKRMLIEPSSSAMERFLREAKVQGRLDHPAIVPVYELAHDTDGRPFFVMKRLTGTTLADVLAKRDPRFTRQKLLRAFADACLAIELAHSRDVIHRDLKPSNIMLGDFGEVYVLDWGIARVLGETDPLDAAKPTTAERQLTQAGAILGTPGYIAPELVRGEPIGASADVFGLGCILFEILAGEPLVRGNALAVLVELDARPSQRATDRDIAPELDAACVAATAGDPAARPTARALAEMIERFLDGDRDLAQRKRVASGHLEAARAALATGDGEAERAVAMREAGRALALDPSSGAADLLGRLMLEPPAKSPVEVEARLSEFDDRSTRAKARFFLPTYLILLVTTPLLVVAGLHGVTAIVALCVTAVANLATASLAVFSTRPTTARNLYLAALSNGLLIGVAGWLFGSVLVGPPIAIISMMMFVSDQRLKFKYIAAITIGPAMTPVLFDLFGLFGHRLAVVNGDILVHSESFTNSVPWSPITFMAYITYAVLVAGTATKRIAASERAAIRSVELQAWHLRKLVGK